MTGVGYLSEWETECPNGEDGVHCDHWYDDSAPCCRCVDDGGKVHGDHHPMLDCEVCSDRIADGRTTLAEVYELAERRFERLGKTFTTPPPYGDQDGAK